MYTLEQAITQDIIGAEAERGSDVTTEVDREPEAQPEEPWVPGIEKMNLIHTICSRRYDALMKKLIVSPSDGSETYTSNTSQDNASTRTLGKVTGVGSNVDVPNNPNTNHSTPRTSVSTSKTLETTLAQTCNVVKKWVAVRPANS
ncbi:hypothetical protein CBL_10110 [Carabus blaptoides fortunei]